MTDIAMRARQEDIAFQEKLYNDPNPTRRGLHRARRDWIECHLREHVQSGSKVLEVGVGCGVFTRCLSDLGASTIAVDINQSFLDGVSGLPGVSVRNADATRELDCTDRDLVLCSEVLEHVPPSQSQAMLDQLAKALRPGGILILTTPQKYATVELVARLFKFRPILAVARLIYGTAEELGHTNLLSKSQLRKQISNTALSTREEHLMGFYLPVVAEFGGKFGAKLLNAIGRLISHMPILRGLVWTQAYVLAKPERDDSVQFGQPIGTAG